MGKPPRWRHFYKPDDYSTTAKFWILLHLIALDLEEEMQQIEAEMNYQKYNEKNQEERI
ncbi:hypothetical protein [Listeria booriae]|uniref:hypothetical protein n=1 Tax=Listeria booriae TaxID=1552123 RepID=UPI001629C64D|nr:hypothetical protein [Listeria booriae]MBC2323808.1 hypothetical protein [Listeria booriae]MCD2207691.1 hypothetical protein [Listeria booriae]